MAKISVIIPVYNVEKYLKECLDSLLIQTLKDIEIICIDDCSTDSSPVILAEYAKRDSRIRVFRNEENRGQGYSRNKGIEYAQGEYIGFVDADDEIENNYFEYLYNRAKSNDADMACARIVYDFLKKKNRRSGDWVRLGIMDGSVLTSVDDKLTRVYQNCSTSSSKHIYRADFIKNNNINFLAGYYHEDQYFNIKAYYFANKVVLEKYDSPVYLYKVHNNSSMNLNKNSEKYKRSKFDQFIVMRKILQFLDEKKVSQSVIDAIMEDFKTIVLNCVSEIDVRYLSEYIRTACTFQFDNRFKKRLKKFRIIRLLNIVKPKGKLGSKLKKLKNLFKGECNV